MYLKTQVPVRPAVFHTHSLMPLAPAASFQVNVHYSHNTHIDTPSVLSLTLLLVIAPSGFIRWWYSWHCRPAATRYQDHLCARWTRQRQGYSVRPHCCQVQAETPVSRGPSARGGQIWLSHRAGTRECHERGQACAVRGELARPPAACKKSRDKIKPLQA